MLQCKGYRLPGYRSCDICAFALHSLDDCRGIPAGGVWSKKYWVTLLDSATVEQAVDNCADIGHRPDIRHRELIKRMASDEEITRWGTASIPRVIGLRRSAQRRPR